MKNLVKKTLFPLPTHLDRLLHSVLLKDDVPRWLDDRRAFPGLGTPAERLTGVGAPRRVNDVLTVLYDALGTLGAPGLPQQEVLAAQLRNVFTRRLAKATKTSGVASNGVLGFPKTPALKRTVDTGVAGTRALKPQPHAPATSKSPPPKRSVRSKQ